jgi:predicted RNA-binding protein with PIN domain
MNDRLTSGVSEIEADSMQTAFIQVSRSLLQQQQQLFARQSTRLSLRQFTWRVSNSGILVKHHPLAGRRQRAQPTTRSNLRMPELLA